MTMRKIPFLAVAVCAVALAGATGISAQQTTVGAGLAYTDLDDIDLGLQVNAYVAIPTVPGLRVGGDFTYYLPQTEMGFDLNFFALNGNVQYFLMSAPEFGLYALGGVSLGRARVSFDGDSESETDIGLNLGIGGEFGVGFGALFGEAKLVTGDFDRVTVAAGIRIPIM